MEDFDETDDMEMPCPCIICGDWFELNDGFADQIRKKDTVICPVCNELQERAKTTIGELTKCKKFIHDGIKYQVVKKWRSTERPLEAFEIDYRTGTPVFFDDSFETVFLLDYTTEELTPVP